MTRIFVPLLFVLFGCDPDKIFDQDGDGYDGGPRDCDDQDPNVYLGAPEICGNGVDDNCNGIPDRLDTGSGGLTFYKDTDRDGFGNTDDTATACEQPPDGYAVRDGDCDDSNPNRSPGRADDTCDGIDDDCDDEIDEDADRSNYYADEDQDGYGDGPADLTCDPQAGWVDNDEDCDDSNKLVNPRSSELCNAVDDDCDGTIDEGLLGSGEACPADDCAQLYEVLGDEADGRFWLRDDADVFRAECDVDARLGGGWLKVDLATMREQDWVVFNRFGDRTAKWDERRDKIILDPGFVNSCSDVGPAVRAELKTPTEFTEVRGFWIFQAHRPSTLPHSGVDNIDNPFSSAERCIGGKEMTGVLFGNPNNKIKPGGTADGWGNNGASPYTFIVGKTSGTVLEVLPTRDLWWEISGSQENTYVGAELTEVSLYVR